MSVQDEVERLVELAYDTALDPSLWGDFLERIGEALGACQGSLFLHSPGIQLMTDWGFGQIPELKEIYNTKYVSEDPWSEPTLRTPVGHVATGQELKPTKTFERTDFFQECMLPYDLYDCLVVQVERNPGLNAVVVFNRPEWLPRFGETERRFLAKLAPHVRQAVRIQRQFEDDAAISMLQSAALDQVAFGVIVLGRQSGIRYANRIAEMILAANDGLGFRNNRLHASRASDDTILSEAQQRVLSPAKGLMNSSGSFSVSVVRPSNQPAYALQVTPISPKLKERIAAFGESDGLALVVIVDPARTKLPAHELVREAYALTTTESQLTVMMAEGLSLKGAAEQLSMTEQTARWHMKNILSKTDTNRQSELLNLLLRMVSPLA